MKQIEGLNFQPYIGKNYGKNANTKLLFLGESFYDNRNGTSQSNYTTEIINEFLDDENYITYERMGYLFDDEDCRKIWHEVAFANFIQTFLVKSNDIPTKEDVANGKIAFKLLLDALKPNKVIVFSKRLWNSWIAEDNGSFIRPLDEAGLHSTIWKYKYNGGECLATGVNHTRSRGMNKDAINSWSKLIKVFLNN